jgi:hypothetical protein
VLDGELAVGWCQFSKTKELPNINYRLAAESSRRTRRTSPAGRSAFFLYNATRGPFGEAGFSCSRPKGKNHCVMTATVAPAGH